MCSSDLVDHSGWSRDTGRSRTGCRSGAAGLTGSRRGIVPIPGTTKLERFEENIEAVNVELTPKDLQEIETAAAKIQVQGARYPEELERLSGL